MLELTVAQACARASAYTLEHVVSLSLAGHGLANVAILAGSPALRWLDLAGNRFTTLPAPAAWPALLPALTTLDLSGNALVSLEGLRGSVPALHTLRLHGNAALELAHLAPLQGHPALQVLTLAGTAAARTPGYAARAAAQLPALCCVDEYWVGPGGRRLEAALAACAAPTSAEVVATAPESDEDTAAFAAAMAALAACEQHSRTALDT
jgi:hypothetical protein